MPPVSSVGLIVCMSSAPLHARLSAGNNGVRRVHYEKVRDCDDSLNLKNSHEEPCGKVQARVRLPTLLFTPGWSKSNVRRGRGEVGREEEEERHRTMP